MTADKYGIDFLKFSIRDIAKKKMVFEVSKPENTGPMPTTFPPGFDPDSLRTIEYDFPASFLKCTTVGTSLEFKVGKEHEVKDFYMIEMHFFKGKLVKKFDFKFPFCIPGARNSWEAIYDMPKIEDVMYEEMVSNEFRSESDSFYFVQGQLVMHNKARYNYVDDDSDDEDQDDE